jgi:hypothetical protein
MKGIDRSAIAEDVGESGEDLVARPKMRLGIPFRALRRIRAAG